MTMADTLHTTLVFERVVAAQLSAVFAACPDPVEREMWGIPSDIAVVIYDEAGFRDGGQDCYHCGSKSNRNIHSVTQYLDIQPNRRIVSSETITVDGKEPCTSLNTLDLTGDGDQTRLESTT